MNYKFCLTYSIYNFANFLINIVMEMKALSKYLSFYLVKILNYASEIFKFVGMDELSNVFRSGRKNQG